MARRITASQARDQLSEIINRAAYAGERIIVHRRKKPVAAVVPLQDLELLQQVEEQMDVEDAMRALKERRGKNWLVLKQELGL